MTPDERFKALCEIELDFTINKKPSTNNEVDGWKLIEYNSFYDNLVKYKETNNESYFNELWPIFDRMTRKFANKHITKKMKVETKMYCFGDTNTNYSTYLYPVLMKAIEKWQPNQLSFYRFYENRVKYYTNKLIFNYVRDHTINKDKEFDEENKYIIESIEQNKLEVRTMQEIKQRYYEHDNKLFGDAYVHEFCKGLNIKQQLVYMSLISDRFTYEEIGNHIGASKRTVINIVKQIREEWRKYNDGTTCSETQSTLS